jgi:hypothetical protein
VKTNAKAACDLDAERNACGRWRDDAGWAPAGDATREQIGDVRNRLRLFS